MVCDNSTSDSIPVLRPRIFWTRLSITTKLVSGLSRSMAKRTYRIDIVYILEPTVIVIAILAIGTNMSISAVEAPTIATIRTASRTSTLLEHQLLSRTQALAMIIVTVLASFTLAVEMVVIADLLVLHAFSEAYSGCLVGAWQRRVEAFFVSIEEDELAVCCLFACDVDGLGGAFAYGCPGRALAGNGGGGLGQTRCSCLCWGRRRVGRHAISRERIASASQSRARLSSSCCGRHKNRDGGSIWQWLRSKDCRELYNLEAELGEARLDG
jgi:hypothetical protein